jgi:hypothetical protein
MDTIYFDLIYQYIVGAAFPVQVLPTQKGGVTYEAKDNSQPKSPSGFYDGERDLTDLLDKN